MAISKEAQVAEAKARSEAGIDPAQSAAALDVIDDVARGTEPSPEPRAPAPAPEPAPVRAPPPVKSRGDDMRNAIISRFREDRVTAPRDELSDFQADGGMPLDWAQMQEAVAGDPAAPAAPAEPAAAAPEAAPAAEPPAAPAKPTMVKVKVYGQEREVTLEEALAKAQIAYASDDLLETAKSKVKTLDSLIEDARTRVARVDPAQHQGQVTAQPSAEPPADPAADPNQVDPLREIIEGVQFGDPAEVAPKLRNIIAQEASRVAGQVLLARDLQNEGRSAGQVLADFKTKHADIASDPMATAAIEAAVVQQQRDDIERLGIPLNQLRRDGGEPTPQDFAAAHAWLRTQGRDVASPATMLAKATDKFLEWKGVKSAAPPPPTPTPEPTTPAPAPAPKAPVVEITVERQERRAAAPQQPSQPGVIRPAPAAAQQAQPRDRSQIVLDMLAKRNAPRGKVGIGA